MAQSQLRFERNMDNLPVMDARQYLAPTTANSTKSPAAKRKAQADYFAHMSEEELDAYLEGVPMDSCDVVRYV
jgi:hypothetical protein